MISTAKERNWEMKKKKIIRIVVIISIIVVAIIAGVVGVFMYQKNERKKDIQYQISVLKDIEKNFNEKQTQEDKMKVLKTTLKEQGEYNKNSDKYEKVSDEFDKIISNMRKSIIAEYDGIQQENTVEDINKEKDTKQIKEKSNKLKELSTTIDLDKKYVFADTNDAEKYKNSIDELVQAYDKRIVEIKKAQKKAEARKRALILSNTYVTGKKNNGMGNHFQFKYPSGWKIEKKEYSNEAYEVAEKVVLGNGKGATITFWDCQHELGGRSSLMSKAKITKASSSDFVPSCAPEGDFDTSSLGKFMVAKVHIVGEMDKYDTDYNPVDSVIYAVVPEKEYLGTREFQGQAGFVDEFSFNYPTPFAFIAETSNKSFSKLEEQQVIAILKSFKEV